MSSYIDIHSHLHDKAFDSDREAVLSRMRESGVATITVGTDFAESQKAVSLAEKHDDVWATIGVHPTDTDGKSFNNEAFLALAKHPKVVAVGECGLDYFRLENEHAKGNIESIDEEVDRQQGLFEEQIALAVAAKKPLMLHGRPRKGTMDAYEDMLQMLKNYDGAGNVHFFSGDTAIAKRFLHLGFTLSFTGVLTFTHDYDEVVKYIPLDYLHAETDAPYVAPAPYRGKRNEPVYVIETVKALARIRGEAEETVKAQLIANAKRTFSVG